MSKRKKSAQRQSGPVSTMASSTLTTLSQTAPPTTSTEPPRSKRQVKREAATSYTHQQRIKRYAALTVVGIVVLISVGLVVREVARPKPGEAVAVMSSDHIPETAAKPDYNSNPPTSGPHYADTAGQGFYEPGRDVPKDEFLVHNLEHGHVILWYDCSKLDQAQCDILKGQLQGVLVNASLAANTPTKKIVIVPRKDFGSLIALTSWGRIQKLDTFDAAYVNTFIQEWREKSPEPNAA